MSEVRGRPLTLAIVCYPSLGGSGVVASSQAAGLARLGHRVHLVSTALPGRPLPAIDGLTFHRVDVPDYPLFEHAPYDLALASALIDLGRVERLDLIHVHYAVPHAASAYLAREALAVEGRAPRVVTSLHGSDVMRVGILDAYRSATRFAVMQSDGLVVPSEFLRREAVRLLALPESARIEVIPNFVDLKRFVPAPALSATGDGSPGPREPVLVHVSNFRPVKRVTDTLEVLARVRQRFPARLVLVGDGPDRQAAQALSRALGLVPWVTFLGPSEDFLEELQRADLFLLPSEMESFGVAALESLAAGVPVFGYRVGGLPELITGEAGRLVAPLDVEALASAVIDALERPELLAELRRGARRRAEGYALSTAMERYESHLRALLPAVTPAGTPAGTVTL